jgi:hypothetical protein
MPTASVLRILAQEGQGRGERPPLGGSGRFAVMATGQAKRGRSSCERHGLPEMAINVRATAGTAQLARCRYIVLRDQVERQPDLS